MPADPVYAVRADLALLGVGARSLVAFSDEEIAEALAAASRFVDGYFRSRFKLPLLSWGRDLARVACTIAAYDLMVARGYNPDAGADANFRLRYEDAQAWLKDVANGRVTPSVTDSSPGSSVGAPAGVPTVYTSSQRGWSSRGTGYRGGGFVGD